METKVAYSKSKSRFVSKTFSEDEFNSDPNRTFNDVWIQNAKKTFQKVNMDVVNFLNRASIIAKNTSSQEQKFDVTEKEEFSRISSKIDLEFKNLKSEIEETIKLVKDTKSLNPNQAQIYTGYQQSMCQVLDEKLPTLLKQLSSLATPDDILTVKKYHSEIISLEQEIKPKLNLLVHSIAEKTEFTAVASSNPLSSAKPISASPSVTSRKCTPLSSLAMR